MSWVLYVSDFVALVPSQLLPFEKTDPSTWYIKLMGVEGTGMGFAFGVVPAASIGWDWLELLVKGAVFGYILTRIQSWYCSRSRSFWVTVLFVYLMVVSYNCFRASWLYFIPMVGLRFMPFYLLIRSLSHRVQFSNQKMQRDMLPV